MYRFHALFAALRAKMTDTRWHHFNLGTFQVTGFRSSAGDKTISSTWVTGAPRNAFFEFLSIWCKQVINYRVYHLKRNPTTITYYSTKMKSEAGPSPCNRLSQKIAMPILVTARAWNQTKGFKFHMHRPNCNFQDTCFTCPQILYNFWNVNTNVWFDELNNSVICQCFRRV
jgi:hypothetical protein